MNRITPLFLLLFVFVACNKPNDEKAHELVEAYCNNNFFSPDEYKPLTYESLKPHYHPYEQTNGYKTLDDKRQKLEKTRDSLSALMYGGSKKAIYQKSKTDSIVKVLEAVNNQVTADRDTYKGVQDGWTIAHTYNKKEAGRIVQGRSVFTLDKGLTRVLQATDQ
ncbi:hypothetical protein KXQ82_07460 [Mucilaginibacter sp. HMF5004]|uniref:hypothetical protein n=1 Tax=Mucilaginibacter rivuli TaxID=2857527 RepID=UPI001C5D903F|nr:hypothetical protein [Mucilaginibacter rivuli]MBW4889546.1 hypothetical protein [Mucilaginibacter rivuli]